MNILDAINGRRSIRKFTGEVVNNEQIKIILQAGFQAPSAHNLEPRDFIVLRDKEMLEKIALKHPYAKMLPNAGCCIVVCGNKEIQKQTGFLIQDCSASIQNMLLAAHGINLGAVWCGIHPVASLIKMVRDYLELPSNIVPVGLVVIGNKSEDKRVINRYNEAKVHIEKW